MGLTYFRPGTVVEVYALRVWKRGEWRWWHLFSGPPSKPAGWEVRGRLVNGTEVVLSETIEDWDEVRERRARSAAFYGCVGIDRQTDFNLNGGGG